MARRNQSHHSTRYLFSENDTSEKKFPELYPQRENCCGCGACSAICPVKAIEMLPDEEGFLYPSIHADLCVCCYQCLKICVFKQDQKGAN